MKTFKEFILICEKLNKTHEENSQSKLWNYFIANPDNLKIRNLILDKNYKEAEKEIKKEVEAAKINTDHPLNFINAGDEEFSKKTGRQSSDEKPYNDFLDDSISGLLALTKEKKLKTSIERGFPSRVTGSGAAELSKKFKSAGGTDKTPKADLEVYNPDNPKDRRGISMKKGTGAQLASAEGGEIKGMFKIAAKEYVKRFHSDKSKEERQKIEKEIMNDAERLSAIGRLQKTAGEASDPEKQKQSLKNISQGISDKLLDKYPQFERLLSQVATSGKGKFKGDEGTAGIVLTGKTKRKEASAKSAEQQKSERPRLALPKESGRPGNLKIDYRPEKPVSRQSSFTDFSKKIEQDAKAQAEAEAQHSQTTAELEQQANQANANVSAAQAEVDKANDPSELRYVDGTEPLIQNRKRFQDFIGRHSTDPTVQHIVQARTMAQDNLISAQSVANDATTSYQTHISTPPKVQPTQPEQPQQPAQTPPQQPVQQQPAPEQPPAPPAPEQPPAPQPAPEQPPAPQPAPEQPPAPQPAPEQPPAPQRNKNKKEKKPPVEPPVEIAPEQGQ